VDQSRKLQDLDDRLRVVETKVHDIEQKMSVFSKVFWIALTALITGGIAVTFWGPNA
jgi:hypothetical protein